MSKSIKARILVIDDDEGIRKVITTALNDESYITDTASSGKEAIEKSKTNAYNLAIIDIHLPDMEGTQLLSELKETTPKMRKIIVTGFPEVQNVITAVKKGANDYITKPVNIDVLINSIREQLRKQQEEKNYSEEKVTEYIETRLRENQP
ncbi:MAG TPA: response regulator [Candidatus Bathyarchaeia archaeon]|nr:response regulator [Candidatus Bathyarchaeia archaeon]HKM79137.1 response regulator [Candidatus Bathyarchaeia archaeon]